MLGCAVTTGVGAVVRTAVVRPGESVLVIGCGGVGLAAIQGARLAGAARIIAAYGASDPARDIPALAELALRRRLDLEALVTRRIGIDDVETPLTDMAAGPQRGLLRLCVGKRLGVTRVRPMSNHVARQLMTLVL